MDAKTIENMFLLWYNTGVEAVWKKSLSCYNLRAPQIPVLPRQQDGLSLWSFAFSEVDMKRMTPELHERILERDAYVCGYCNGEAVEVDHIIPWAYCENNDEGNLIASCRDCNAIASDHVFDSLGEKRQYIMTIRSGKKWTRKLKNRYSKCIVCGEKYSEGRKGATHFICADCVRRGYEYVSEFKVARGQI